MTDRGRAVETLHLFFTAAVPDSVRSESEALLIQTGFEGLGEDEPIRRDDLEFVTTLVSNLADPSLLPEAVDRWWRDVTGSSARIELIANDRRLFAPHVLQRLARLDADAWSINSTFVGFKRGSPAARREAIELVMKSSVLSH